MALEDAGFEVREKLYHLFGSGFPKSLDISRAIDELAPRLGMFAGFAAHYEDRRKAAGLTHREICDAGGFHGEVNHGGASSNWAAGYNVPTREQWEVIRPLLGLSVEWRPLIERAEAEREAIGDRVVSTRPGIPNCGNPSERKLHTLTAPATASARQWEGWGTATKPAAEEWILCRKPISESTIAGNVLRWGCGGLNVDGCRVGSGPAFVDRPGRKSSGGLLNGTEETRVTTGGDGRWPPNVLLSHAEACSFSRCHESCPVRLLDEQSGTRTSGAWHNVVQKAGDRVYGLGLDDKERIREDRPADSGGASRFFPVFWPDPLDELTTPFLYIPKPDRAERDMGCENLPARSAGECCDREEGSAGLTSPRAGAGRTNGARNHHPTVKSVALMRWLCRLITQPGGMVLDPFTGSGSTGAAALAENFRFVGVEQDPNYLVIARARCAYAAGETGLFAQEVTA